MQPAAYIAAVIVTLFDIDVLANLPASLAPFEQLADEHFVHRALLRQMHYLGEVGAHLQDSEYHVAWGLFHLRWLNKEFPPGFGLRLRSVTLYLPQPVAAAIKYPPLPNPPTLGQAYFPEPAGDPPSFLLAKWRHETTARVSHNFTRWFRNLATPGPHLSTILDKSNVHWEVIQQGHIPPLRLTIITRVPCAGPSGHAAAKYGAYGSPNRRGSCRAWMDCRSRCSNAERHIIPPLLNFCYHCVTTRPRLRACARFSWPLIR